MLPNDEFPKNISIVDWWITNGRWDKKIIQSIKFTPPK